jgi:glyoxylase-like metal-dependent hydrolase (beta-lactamase superfamily II)
MSWSVHVLKLGECDVRGPEVYWMSHWDTWETLYFYMVVARGPDGVVVINTGPPRDLSSLNASWTDAFGERGALRRLERELPEHALTSLDLTPVDVTHVLITPLQAYATAHIPLFPNARVCLSRRGWIEDFHAPRFPLHVPPELRIPDDVLRYLTTDGRERLHLLDDEATILPGLSAFWAGVHHRSSMAYKIATAAGNVIVSDCCFTYENIEKPHPLGIMESLEECHVTYQRIRREADVVIPLYDPQVLARFPGGRIA